MGVLGGLHPSETPIFFIAVTIMMPVSLKETGEFFNV
jgi:hypothetical protein